MAKLTPDGVASDRLVHVGLSPQPLASRTSAARPFPASTRPDGRPLVTSLPSTAPRPPP